MEKNEREKNHNKRLAKFFTVVLSVTFGIMFLGGAFMNKSDGVLEFTIRLVLGGFGVMLLVTAYKIMWD